MWPYIVGIGLALAVAFVGGALTELGPWYENLKKPSWQPPGFLFGPVWTVLFIMIGVSAALAWMSAGPDAKGTVVALFAINAIFNMAWSGLFFKARRPDWAFYEVIPFWISIAVLIVALWPVSQTASWLLVPYALWVAFAAVLNRTVARLNGFL